MTGLGAVKGTDTRPRARHPIGRTPFIPKCRTAVEAWLLWPADWFLDASLVRKGARLRGKAEEWPYWRQEP
jgi:hypothetical protein